MLTKNQALYLRTLKEINDLERNRFTNSFFQSNIDLFVHDQKVKKLNEALKTLFYRLRHHEKIQVEVIKNRNLL